MRLGTRCALIIVLLASIARAGPDEKDPAKLYAAAQQKYVARHYQEALEDFQKLLATTDSPNARLYVARCLRDLGRSVEAWQEMQRTVEHAARKSAQDPSYEQTRAAAEAEAREIATTIGRIRFELPQPPVEGLRVSVDGVEVANPREVAAVRPGRVSVRASAVGRAPLETTLEIRAGEERSVSLELAPAQTTPHPVEVDTKISSSAGPDRTWAYVAAGVGAAGFATFAIAGLAANSKYDSLRSECAGHCSSDDLAAGKRLDLIANVGLGVGVVGVGVGAALWFLATPDRTENVSIGVDERGGFLGYQRQF